MALLLQSYYSITVHDERLTPATHTIYATNICLKLLNGLFQTGERDTEGQGKKPPIWSSG